MFHIPKNRKVSIGMTVDLESFSGQDNETILFCPLKVADGAFDGRPRRGFWAMSKYGTLLHRIVNVRPGIIG